LLKLLKKLNISIISYRRDHTHGTIISDQRFLPHILINCNRNIMLRQLANSSLMSRTTTFTAMKFHRRNIVSGERPQIIHERLQSIAAETEAKTEKRMGWLKLGTMYFVGIAGGYCVLFQEFKDSNGNDYEHCFKPIRRVYRSALDTVLGFGGSDTLEVNDTTATAATTTKPKA
jgi:hypothetical protein